MSSVQRSTGDRGILQVMDQYPASDRLRSDHREIEFYLDGLREALRNLSAERIRSIQGNFREIQRLACRHLEQEERVFYPVLRRLAPDLLSQMDKQHQDIRDTEKFLEDVLRSFPALPSERDWAELYRLGVSFHDSIQHHIVEEEDHLLHFADQRLSLRQQEQALTEMQKIATPSQESS
ncbi:MAG: hemerythrin domain-containing protein [Acidobacteria bacterium]|nr:hemerythrin domain-containing protein [Acidobacteriota bacterium]